MDAPISESKEFQQSVTSGPAQLGKKARLADFRKKVLLVGRLYISIKKAHAQEKERREADVIQLMDKDLEIAMHKDDIVMHKDEIAMHKEEIETLKKKLSAQAEEQSKSKAAVVDQQVLGIPVLYLSCSPGN